MHSIRNNVRTYLPYSVLRSPKTFATLALKDVLSSMTIAWALFYRDFSAKYRQTLTGYLSAFIPVIVTTLSFVFLQRSNVVNFSESQIDYGSFVFINTIVWELFSECCLGPTKEINNNISSIIRLNFPRESLFFASLLNVSSNFLIKVAGAILFFSVLQIKMTWNLVHLFPLLIGLIAWASLIGLLILPFSILYSDFKTVFDVALRLLFFLTPITYQIDYDRLGHSWIPRLNILSQYFTALKEIVFYGRTPENITFIWTFSLLGLVVIVFGWIVYRVSVPILIERMPS